MHDIIELWHWRVTDKVSRRHFITRHRMTQADALDFDPAAERVEGSLERRVVRHDPRATKHERPSAQSPHSAGSTRERRGSIKDANDRRGTGETVTLGNTALSPS